MTLKLDWMLKGSDFEDMTATEMSRILRDISDDLYEGFTANHFQDIHKVTFLKWEFVR